MQKNLLSDTFATAKDLFVFMCANPLCKTTKLIENHSVIEKGVHLHSDCRFYCNQLSQWNAYGEKKTTRSSSKYAFNMDQLASFIAL